MDKDMERTDLDALLYILRQQHGVICRAVSGKETIHSISR